MSTNRGIFENYPDQPGTRQDSPFTAVPEQAAESGEGAASPFTAIAKQESPFSAVDEGGEAGSGEYGRPMKLPERRMVDSPFQVADPTEGFGLEPVLHPSSPFEVVPTPAAASPFSIPAPIAAASPFAVAETPRPVASPAHAPIAAFSQWQEPAATAPLAQAAPPAAFRDTIIPAFSTPAAQVPSAFALPSQTAPTPTQAVPAPAPPAPAAEESQSESQSDSFHIRQLELRAIFGVDREMNADEILQRARALPGMRNITKVGPGDVTTINALRTLIPSLGFGSGALKLYAGSVPLEFIREGQVMLAVQTDGGFAPGVRETLMLVARELGRMG